MFTVWQLERIAARPFQWVLSPFANTHPLVPLALVSLVASILLLLAFRWLSDQAGLEQVKARVHAHFLELKLFRHDVGIIWSAEKQILRHNFLYVAYLLKPLFITLPIFALILIELEGWFSSRPLEVGEAVVVSVFVEPEAARVLETLRLADAGGLRVETPALKIREENRADFRVRALKSGDHELKVIADQVGPAPVTKRMRVGREQVAYVSRARSAPCWFSGFLNSEESPLSPGSRISRIEVDYPVATLTVLGWRVNWVVAFLLLSIVFAFALKRPLGIVL